MSNEDPSLYFVFSEKKVNMLNELLSRANIKENQFVFNEYTDYIEIIFDDSVKVEQINIVCKVYNIYGYGGFFGSGWCYNI
jgi:hypothetical protein